MSGLPNLSLGTTVQFGFSCVKGRIHSSNFEIANEENACIHTTEIMLKTVCDLLVNEDLQVRYPDFKERKDFI